MDRRIILTTCSKLLLFERVPCKSVRCHTRSRGHYIYLPRPTLPLPFAWLASSSRSFIYPCDFLNRYTLISVIALPCFAILLEGRLNMLAAAQRFVRDFRHGLLCRIYIDDDGTFVRPNMKPAAEEDTGKCGAHSATH